MIKTFNAGDSLDHYRMNEIIDAVNRLSWLIGDEFIHVNQVGNGIGIGLNLPALMKYFPPLYEPLICMPINGTTAGQSEAQPIAGSWYVDVVAPDSQKHLTRNGSEYVPLVVSAVCPWRLYYMADYSITYYSSNIPPILVNPTIEGYYTDSPPQIFSATCTGTEYQWSVQTGDSITLTGISPSLPAWHGTITTGDYGYMGQFNGQGYIGGRPAYDWHLMYM